MDDRKGIQSKKCSLLQQQQQQQQPFILTRLFFPVYWGQPHLWPSHNILLHLDLSQASSLQSPFSLKSSFNTSLHLFLVLPFTPSLSTCSIPILYIQHNSSLVLISCFFSFHTLILGYTFCNPWWFFLYFLTFKCISITTIWCPWTHSSSGITFVFMILFLCSLFMRIMSTAV